MKQLKNKVQKLHKQIKSTLKSGKKVYFFFDYDGVLVPLKDDPRTTYLPVEIRKKIVKLSALKGVKVALVSGRNLSTLKRLTGFKSKKITLVGSHGLEVFSSGKNGYLFKNDKKVMNKLKPEAIKIAKSIANGFTEIKPYSFTYHIRDSRKGDFVNELYRAISKLIRKSGYAKDLKVLPGRLMVEILPKNVTKGKAVEKLIEKEKNALYVCFGDDVTDIYAFKSVKKFKGITISLNRHLDYKADFLLKSPNEVHELITGLLL